MTKKYRFVDEMNFRILDYNQEDLARVKDDYPGAFKPQPAGAPHPSGLGLMPGSGTSSAANLPSGRGLVIKVAATHAGLITRNNGFYLPDRMRNGVPTWTEHYNKPIQVHHEDHKDPVGRVISARYVETVGAVTDRFKNHVLRDSYGKQVGIADHKFWQSFSAEGSFYNKLQQIKLMDSILEDPHYSGVGYIELTADITDPEAIQKVLDGRFLTGSVGAVSDKAVCSVCNTNWLEEDHCGHKPGKVYDGKRCFVVAGNLEYDEWSFVNTPADRHAVVLSSGEDKISDSVVEDSASRVFYFIPTSFDKEGSEMKDTATEVKPVEADVEDATSTQEGVVEALQDQVAVEDTAAASTEIVEDSVASTEETAIEDSVDALSQVEPFELSLEKLFVENAAFTDEDEEVLYTAMMSTLTEEDKVDIEEAKLSTASRKKLPSSAFCGPERSFPVNDCAHYTAAKRLLGRYKGPGDKSTILACIERKGKALGCSSSKDGVACDPCVETGIADAVEEVKIETPAEQELHIALKHTYTGELDDAAKLAIAQAFMDQLVQHLGGDTLVAALVEKKLAVSKDMLDAQVEETLKHETTVGELRDQLSALRRELAATYDDVAQLEDRLIEKAVEAREAKVARLTDLHKLDNSFNEDLGSQFATISDEALDNSLAVILAKVDTAKIADKLNNGLSRVPEEKVKNPAAVTEPSSAAEFKDKVDTETEVKPNFAKQRMVDETYHYLFVTKREPNKAKKYYSDMVAAGFAVADPTKMLNHDNKEE